jgi:cobaltochelatase CobS
MARTPSMTAEECESALGRRGAVGVRSDNRGLVQKWLTARGVPAGIAKAATIQQLASAYNDTTDAYLAHLAAKAVRNTDTQQETPDTMSPRSVSVTKRECGACKAPIGWLRSRRTHKLYPVNAPGIGAIGEPTEAYHNDFHRCAFGEHQGTTEDAQDAEPAGFPEPPKANGHAPEPKIIEREKIVEKRVEVVPAALKAIMDEMGTDAAGLAAMLRNAMPREHKQFRTLLKAASARTADGHRLNVWLAGGAGSGKTTAARNVAKSLGLPFYFNGAIDNEYKLLGFTDAQGRLVSRPFRQAYEHGGVYLFDEVDASLPAALLAFNAALANGQVDFPDRIVERHRDCVIIAAGNTYGHGATSDYVGRFKQDAAFMDRFAFLNWETDEELERATCPDRDWCAFVQKTRARARSQGLKVIISPRASYYGAALLAAGLDRDAVVGMTLRKGLSDDQWNALS